MNEEDGRRLLLVRAVESEDAAETLLTREDRRYATEAALAHAPVRAGGRSARKANAAFLAARSHYAFERLAPRYPAVVQAERSAHWPGWISWLLPLAALLLGALSNEIDSSRRLNIIAFPLIGMLVWNLAVYLLLALGALRRTAGRREEAKPGGLARLLERATQPAGRLIDAQPPLGQALRRFAKDWLRFSSKLTYSRASRTLHLAAACLAAGALLGMYLRALGYEYRAGWESTFIGADTLHRLISVVLGPASLLSGIALPGPEQLEALRWSERGRGENAAPWIHLYAITAFLFIIGPRLLLAGWHGLRAASLARRFPVPGSEDFYVRRLLRSAQGEGSVVRIVPYSFHPPAGTETQLRQLLSDLLGDKTRVTIDGPIAYGEEDEWLDRSGIERDEADHLILLFNLSATPESENQGALASGILRRLAQGKSAAGLTVLLDESAYRQRLAGQSGAEARLQTRREAWEAMLWTNGAKPLALDLEGGDKATLAAAMETALMQAGVAR